MINDIKLKHQKNIDHEKWCDEHAPGGVMRLVRSASTYMAIEDHKLGTTTIQKCKKN